MISNYCTCGYSYIQSKSYEDSCYFYDEDIDMGARIPWCSYKSTVDPENCNKNCKYYFYRKKVFNLIKEIVENRSE